MGWMGIASSPRGVRKIILPQNSKEEVLSLVNSCRCLIKDYDPASSGDLPQRLKRYLAGEPIDFPDRLDLDGTTHFQQRVWRITQTISYGETKSYGWVASKAGVPGAARAIGQALTRNPLPIVIPCHRVICNDCTLGGFREGVETKRNLLHLENVII